MYVSRHAHANLRTAIVSYSISDHNLDTALRTLTGADTDITTIPENQCIDLRGSRFGGTNIVSIGVVGTAAGIKVDLYEKIGSDYLFIESQTTTAAKQKLKFFNVDGGLIVPYVPTKPGDNAVIMGGGTK